MKSLSSIVKSLNLSEVRFIRKLYNNQPNGEEKKRLKLFELVIAEKEITDKMAAKRLYNCPPNSAYSHVKNRLKTDILNFLLIQDVGKKKDISKLYLIDLNCRKSIMQSELLLARGLYEEGEKLLQKTSKIAEEYELFSEVIKIKRLLRTTAGYRKGIKEYDKYNESLHYHLTEYRKWLIVREYYNKIMLPNLFNTNKKKDYIETTKKCSEELDGYYTKDSSAQFTFYYFLFKISHHNILQEFDLSLDYAKKLMELVQTKKLLNTKPNRAGTKMSQAHVYINLGQFDEAIKVAIEAVANFKSGMINELRALECLFFAYLRNGDYENATATIKRGLAHKRIKSNDLLKARWLFFEANLFYLLNDKEKAFKLLRKNNDLVKDKSGWLFGFKLLEMMLTIEEKDWYWLGYQLNNFNQLLSRQQQANISRAKIIGQIIRSLLSNGGDFDITLEKAAPKIALLESGTGDYYWDPEGYEVLRFEVWLKSKSKKFKRANQNKENKPFRSI